MWKGMLEYFEFSRESEYTFSFKLKEKFGRCIGKKYKYLLIDQEDKFIVYKSYSQKEHKLSIEKNKFLNKKEAELYIREEMLEIINKNILIFTFGRIDNN